MTLVNLHAFNVWLIRCECQRLTERRDRAKQRREPYRHYEAMLRTSTTALMKAELTGREV